MLLLFIVWQEKDEPELLSPVICCTLAGFHLLMMHSHITPKKGTISSFSFSHALRFEQDNYGVTQPAQVRYVHYFYEILRQPKGKLIWPRAKTIEMLSLTGVPKYSKNGCRPFVNIFLVNETQNTEVYLTCFCLKKTRYFATKYRTHNRSNSKHWRIKKKAITAFS